MKKKIAFMPSIGDDNHYTNKIKKLLNELGHEVVSIGSLSKPRPFSPPKNLNDPSIDIIFVFFPHWFYRSKGFFITLIRSFLFLISIRKLKKKKLFYHLTNYFPHDVKFKFLDRFFMNLICKNAEGIICPTYVSKDIFLKLYPRFKKKNFSIIPHPNYEDIYFQKGLDRSQARVLLGLPREATVCLYLGQLREYKGVPELIKLYSEIAKVDDHLLIYGRAENDKVKKKIEKCITSLPSETRKNIHYKEGFVKDEDIHKLYLASDFCATNYINEPANPGSPILSMTFGLPIYGSNKESLPEIMGIENLYGYDPLNYQSKLEVLRKAYMDQDKNRKKIRLLERSNTNHSNARLKDMYKKLIS